MPDHLEIGTIGSIAEFRAFLAEFGGRLELLLFSAERRVDSLEEWLTATNGTWSRRMDQAQSELDYANARLHECLQEEDSDCSYDAMEVDDRSRELAHCQVALEEVSALGNRIQSEAESVRTSLARSRDAIAGAGERGVAYLDHLFGGLEEYRAVTRGAPALPGSGSESLPFGGPFGYSDLEYRHFGGAAFVGDPTAEQVHQGRIGDCYLLAPLAALAAQNPDAIREAIRDNGDGTFAVRLYQEESDGSFNPTWINVTPDFPADPSTGELLFGGTSPDNKDGLWVSLIEKAYAEYNGGYSHIGDGGRIEDALGALTGRAPAPGGMSWTGIREALNSGLAVCAGKFNDRGEIPGRHAYAVLGVRQEEGERLITLQNPWSRDNHPTGYGARFEMTAGEFAGHFDEVVVEGPR